tara:strand:+ start:7522 stop:8067 length:546 start_codon:yes stop_codon:yes gene_type:complete
MYLANFITFLRIFLIIPIIYFIQASTLITTILALFLFVFAGLTDYLDGYIARKTESESSLGALLDLLADKLLVCIVLIWLCLLNTSLAITLPTLIIISRELAISSLRQLVVDVLGKNSIEVSYIGKSKTTVQFIAIAFLIVSPNFGSAYFILCCSLLWIAACISIISLYNYWKSYSKHLTD